MPDTIDLQDLQALPDPVPGGLTTEQLDVILRLVGNKLPPVLEALRNNDCGWNSIMTIACYLLAATFNRHPELLPAAFSLLGALESFYPQAEAEFARLHPDAVSKLIADDVSFFVIPENSKVEQKNN